MNNIKIAIIGGPSSGKTSLINNLKNRGYTCKEEVSREIIKKEKEKGIDQIFLDSPIWFSEKLLIQRIKQFKEAEKNIDQYIFFDRGIPDIVAYLDYIKYNYSNIFIEESYKYRYDKVFILPAWKEIYIRDNERYETFDQAVVINKFLIKWYTKFGYEIKSIPKLSIENRIDFILENV